MTTEPEFKTYTVFCQESSGRGTTWIDTVEAETPQQAQALGIAACRREWAVDEEDEGPDDIACYCVIEGSVKIAIFEDL